MTEPMFFKRNAGLTVSEIISLTGAVPRQGAILERRITNVAPLDRAGPHDLTFFDKIKFMSQLSATQTMVCLTSERMTAHVPPAISALCCADPYRAFVMVARVLFPDSMRPSSLFETRGVVPGAHVHHSARLESDVTIDPGAVVGPRAEIGARTVIAASAIVGPEVRIGRDCTIGAGAAITHALIGDRVIIHSGVRIGQDGYGYMAGANGQEKIPQLGRVIIQDDVEIGANTTIDRGSIRDTMIGEGCKIDNLVQIGHNVQIGRHCILAGQAGIAGSATLGDYVILGGRAAISDHLTVGEGAVLGGGSAVIGNVPPGARWGGHPALPAREWMRGVAVVRSLARRAQSTQPRGISDGGKE